MTDKVARGEEANVGILCSRLARNSFISSDQDIAYPDKPRSDIEMSRREDPRLGRLPRE